MDSQGHTPVGDEPPPLFYSNVMDTGCTFVDFSPICLQPAVSPDLPIYETFDVLFEKVNAWLKTHPQRKVISCESLEFKLKDDGTSVNTTKSTYGVNGKYETSYIKCIRLWVCNKTPVDNQEAQQLRYINLVPKHRKALLKPEFESIASTIGRFNEQIASQPIRGRIINMETESVKFSAWRGDAIVDASVRREAARYSVYCLNIMRIFLEVGTGFVTRIGTMDFVPSMFGNKFETLEQRMMKVNQWITEQPQDVNICNVQSIDYKIKAGGTGNPVDTVKSCYCEHGKWNTYIRMIRVYWSQGSNTPRQQPLQVTYRTFMPGQVTRDSFSLGQYETQTETSKRMLAWINATGAKVMSCETIQVRALNGYQDGNPEVVYFSDSGSYSKYFITGLRLYLDGDYADPPPRVLPPLPQVQKDDDSCTIL